MEHEYSLKRLSWTYPWAVRPLAHLPAQRADDARARRTLAGEPLHDRLIQGPMEMTQFLRFAVALSQPHSAGYTSGV